MTAFGRLHPSEPMTFLVGAHHVHNAHHVDYACISLNRLQGRKSGFRPAKKGTLFDSGGFMVVSQNGEYTEAPEAFTARAASWVRRTPGTMGVVSQDYMCEPFVLAKTGLTVADHQRLTIERYDAILAAWRELFGKPVECGPNAPPIMPVLQGWTVADYLSHLAQYGRRLTPGMWVGVGSVCKRQGTVEVIEDILGAIKEVRPDLRLHGFWGEADGTAESPGPRAPVHRRQHGVVLRCPLGGASVDPGAAGRARAQGEAKRGPADYGLTRRQAARRERHRRSDSFCRAHPHAAPGAGAIPAIRRMTAPATLNAPAQSVTPFCKPEGAAEAPQFAQHTGGGREP